MNFLKRFLKWLFRGELHDQYHRGWCDGVDQHRIEPESCEHHKTIEYWGEEGYEEVHQMELDELDQNPYGMG
tara:strand:+ start:172 stop:387 length:216 start_codon:yes stop_codon:yes gene_type:complete